ncbi:uncharacterized protein ACIGJ3_021717 [Trichechus inunguis]
MRGHGPRFQSWEQQSEPYHTEGDPGPVWAPTLAPLPTVQTEELHPIMGELSQIKAQVDSLLESLECMDQQRDQPAGMKDHEENRGAGSEGFSCGTTEHPQEPRGQRTAPEADSSNKSTDTEEAVKNHLSDQEGSQ